mmetsp:Transcript_7303/g.15953  ORF Transcript_7303/g.15953 Transcript_7303/m.15953 type:complete len:294 (-) Transcript_7303:662-1543(-)|eukprot:CAMPEP_0202902284 /NCGR_PEP_ID=MMETSP1392-20130828/16765_1 /ASSEMBLY_ACC=CAM_ASM_000868 /TAXON_ID=225041 /ORGANISM="Chlamydomonas chlamydogama, Strain SAG 11-48b" /LENGTH=293 /DNA_ID=CAMNT_0049589025 /DNA_START=21 /DNA_END=902 /DNA_ORIENTATION=-
MSERDNLIRWSSIACLGITSLVLLMMHGVNVIQPRYYVSVPSCTPAPECPGHHYSSTQSKGTVASTSSLNTSLYSNLVKEIIVEKELTMLSRARLDNVQELVTRAVLDDVSGDILECGVWKGGASMVMKSVLQTFGSSKKLFCADSFVGLPKMDELDKKVDYALLQQGTTQRMDPAGSYNIGGVTTFKANLAYFQMQDNVELLVGWFNDTLPKAPIKQLAVLRVDGDMYSSTITILDNMYDKVVSGGYVIIDDYGHWPQCRKAVHDWFKARNIEHVLSGIHKIDDTGVWFQKP